jgi:hypothetical protein
LIRQPAREAQLTLERSQGVDRPHGAAGVNRLRPDTPLLFVGDQDGAFGNSGGAVVNRRGEWAGVLSHSPSDVVYLTYQSELERCRRGATRAAGILEVLVNVYDAQGLADELTGKNVPDKGRAAAAGRTLP